MKHSTKQTWEHFSHGADIGVRGYGETEANAFENAALALTAVICDINDVSAQNLIEINCEAPDDELLFADWLNALVYEMATRQMLFSRFEVIINNHSLTARVWGQKVDITRHKPAVEVKGATYTSLHVTQQPDNTWLAQCVVDV